MKKIKAILLIVGLCLGFIISISTTTVHADFCETNPGHANCKGE